MQIQLGTVIATRELHLSNGSPILVEIGMPVQAEDHPDYRCPYRIMGFGSGRVRYAAGVDAIQALILTLETIGVELYASEEFRTGALAWFPEDRSRSLGFPVLEPMRDLLPDDRESGAEPSRG